MSLERTEDGFIVYNLYMGDIPKSFTEEILQKYFSSYGEVSSVEIRFCDDKTTRYAFINFKNADSATSALSTKLHYISDGTNIKQKVVKKADSWWQPNFEDKLKIESDSLIMMLNDDCLIHIFSFLSTRERIKLSYMNDRFKQIFKIINIRNKPVSLLNLTLMEIRFICREFGQLIKEINLECLNDLLSARYACELLCTRFGVKSRLRLQKLNRAPNYVAKYCCELRSLNFKNVRIGEYTKFRLLKYLTKISLRNCDITDEVCFHLSKLQNLKYLDVSENCKLTGKYLKYFPELTHLNLCDCVGIKHYQIVAFCSSNRIIENLKSLNLKSFCLRPEIFTKLASLKNLESLVITSLIDFGLLSNIKKLKHLIIYAVESTCNQYWQLTEKCFTSLETLFIIAEGFSFTPSKAEQNVIFLMKNIRKLGLIRCFNLKDEDMAKIAAMPELTYLNITGCASITLNAFLHLFKKPNKLQHVDISESGFFHNFLPSHYSYQINLVEFFRKKVMETRRTTHCTLYFSGKYEIEDILPWLTIVKERSVFPGMKLRKEVCYEFED